jgi:hypothetical protein
MPTNLWMILGLFGDITAELSGFRIISGACLGRAERVMRNPLERFVAVARSAAAT